MPNPLACARADAAAELSPDQQLHLVRKYFSALLVSIEEADSFDSDDRFWSTLHRIQEVLDSQPANTGDTHS